MLLFGSLTRLLWLKGTTHDLLIAAPHLPQVLLEPAPALLKQRLEQRAAEGAHFTPGTALLDSQLAALQYEEAELLLHVRGFVTRPGHTDFPPPHAVADAVLRRLQRRALPPWATFVPSPRCLAALGGL